MRLEVTSGVLNIYPDSLYEAINLYLSNTENIYHLKDLFKKKTRSISVPSIDKIILLNKKAFIIHYSKNNFRYSLSVHGSVPESLNFLIKDYKSPGKENIKWIKDTFINSFIIFFIPFIIMSLSIYFMVFSYPTKERVSALIENGYIKLTNTCSLDCANSVAGASFYLMFFFFMFLLPIIMWAMMYLRYRKHHDNLLKRMSACMTIMLFILFFDILREDYQNGHGLFRVETFKKLAKKQNEIGFEYKHIYFTSNLLELNGKNRKLSSDPHDK